MAERIDVPPILQGDEESQLRQLWSYLYQLSEAINNNLDAIGGNELTDAEMRSMQQILAAAGGGTGDSIPGDYETLKSLIIKTADFVQSKLAEYRMSLLSESVASGQFGRYVRHTGLDVEVTPEGITQNYTFEEIVQGLKEYEVNAKNYIKTGLLRTVGSIPVYGVAIGKDVVTFSEDGTETYHDGNKVAELTADELSFWQNSVKIAGYTGNRISFYYNGNEVFYIQQGKLYAVGDIEITGGKKLILASNAAMEVKSGGDIAIKTGGTLTVDSNQFEIDASGNAAFRGTLYAASGTFAGKVTASGMEMGAYILKDASSKAGIYLREVDGALIGTFNNVLILNGFTTPNDVNYHNIFKIGYHSGRLSGTYIPYIGNEDTGFDLADRTNPVYRAYMDNIVPGSGSKITMWLAGYASDYGNDTRSIEFYLSGDDSYIVSPANPNTGDPTGHIGTADDPMKDGYFDDLYISGSSVATSSSVTELSNKIKKRQRTVTPDTTKVSSSDMSLLQYGGICVLSIRNLILTNAISTDTKIADISISSSDMEFGAGKALNGSDVFFFVNSGSIYVSGITGAPAGSNIYATIVFPTDSI